MKPPSEGRLSADVVTKWVKWYSEECTSSKEKFVQKELNTPLLLVVLVIHQQCDGTRISKQNKRLKALSNAKINLMVLPHTVQSHVTQGLWCILSQIRNSRNKQGKSLKKVWWILTYHVSNSPTDPISSFPRLKENHLPLRLSLGNHI